MVDHFIKYEWTVPLKDKIAKILWVHSKKYIIIYHVPTTLQTDNGTEFENNIMNQFWLKRNIQYILGLLIISNTWCCRRAYITDQDFLNTSKELPQRLL